MIKLGNRIIITFPKMNKIYESTDLSKQDIEAVRKADTPEEVEQILYPQCNEVAKEQTKIKKLFKKAKNSKLLVNKNGSFYWSDGQFELPLSLPKTLVKAILGAEERNDKDALTAYKNFWILMSLNKDERVRKNLFWFLSKWGLKVAKCGFFVGYRNVDFTDEEGVYTDHHSHKFKIKIGEMVTMDRAKCDAVQENQCSTGLHISNAGWLKEGYYGDQGLTCLVNPADVVAVPYDADYGKLRTCAYLPIGKVKYDESGNIIPISDRDGFVCQYITKVIYEGVYGDEKQPYKIEIPEMPGVDTEVIKTELLKNALDIIKDRVIKENC